MFLADKKMVVILLLLMLFSYAFHKKMTHSKQERAKLKMRTESMAHANASMGKGMKKENVLKRSDLTNSSPESASQKGHGVESPVALAQEIGEKAVLKKGDEEQERPASFSDRDKVDTPVPETIDSGPDTKEESQEEGVLAEKIHEHEMEKTCIRYIVKKNDTLWGIVREVYCTRSHDQTKEIVAKVTQLNPSLQGKRDSLKIDTILWLPRPEGNSPQKDKKKEDRASLPEEMIPNDIQDWKRMMARYHFVEQGETLHTLAEIGRASCRERV